jgi:hypothetical protein
MKIWLARCVALLGMVGLGSCSNAAADDPLLLLKKDVTRPEYVKLIRSCMKFNGFSAPDSVFDVNRNSEDIEELTTQGGLEQTRGSGVVWLQANREKILKLATSSYESHLNSLTVVERSSFERTLRISSKYLGIQQEGGCSGYATRSATPSEGKQKLRDKLAEYLTVELARDQLRFTNDFVDCMNRSGLKVRSQGDEVRIIQERVSQFNLSNEDELEEAYRVDEKITLLGKSCSQATDTEHLALLKDAEMRFYEIHRKEVEALNSR